MKQEEIMERELAASVGEMSVKKRVYIFGIKSDKGGQMADKIGIDFT